MNRSYIVAMIVAGALVLWMLSGQIFGAGEDPDADANANGADETLFAVRAERSTATPREAELSLRGRTEASRIVEVRAETAGRVVALPVAEGARVAEGDLLCQIDVRDRQQRVAQARAALTQRRMEFDAAEDLSGRGFRSETQRAGARAALEQAQADLRSAEIDLANTRIVAPFGGVLDGLGVEVGDLIQLGNTCAIIVDQDPFLVVTQVSEQEVGLLTVGTPGHANLVSGETVSGTVSFIGTRAEPNTRTFRVEIEIPNPDGFLRDGVTADIRIPVRNVNAHLISPAVLTLDTTGRLGVRVVDAGDIVAFYPVEILEDSGNGVWVTGLPEEVTIITVGQEYVVNGQQVDVRLSEPGNSPPPAQGGLRTTAIFR